MKHGLVVSIPLDKQKARMYAGNTRTPIPVRRSFFFIVSHQDSMIVKPATHPTPPANRTQNRRMKWHKRSLR